MFAGRRYHIHGRDFRSGWEAGRQCRRQLGARSQSDNTSSFDAPCNLPLVTIIPKNGRIVFANNDQTTHQVYSFSAVKQFEMTLNRGQTSPPLAFDKLGVAALGCNIHDHMIAYVFVAESPWTALTGADGRAVIEDVPAGTYQAQVWHPKYPPRREPPSARIAVSTDITRWTANIRVLPATTTRSHAGSY